MSMKNPLTSAGIEPTTFRFVAQHLKHCATAVPRFSNWETKIDCAVLPKITGTIPATYVDSSDWGIPEGLVLVDENFNRSNCIDVLLGADVFFEVVCHVYILKTNFLH
jgi:hypothetical protein